MNKPHYFFALCYVVVTMLLPHTIYSQNQFSQYMFSHGRTTKYFYWTTAYDSTSKEYKHFKNPAYNQADHSGDNLIIFGSDLDGKVGQTAIGDINPLDGGEFHFANRCAYQWNFSGLQTTDVKINSVSLEIWYIAGGGTIKVKKLTNAQFNMSHQNRWNAIGNANEYANITLPLYQRGGITSQYYKFDFATDNTIYNDIAVALKAGSLFSLAFMVNNDESWPEMDQFGASMVNIQDNPNEYKGVKLTVNYSLPLNITVQNNFAGGFVTVD